jgi:outer membrane immunogenic protein
MKKFLVAATVAAAFCGAPALAAPPAAPIFNWTGFYVGANAGYSWGSSKIFEDCQDCAPNPIFPMGTFHPDGFIGGGQAGYNSQFNNWVFGLEADFDYDGARASGLGLNNGYIQNIRYHWLATTRARAGVLIGNGTLVFVTGGAAFADIFHSSLNPSGSSGSSTRTGWVIGGGFEHAISNLWSVKLEYLYADLGTTVLHATFIPPRPIFFHYDDTMQILRVGLNYKFGTR